MRYTSCIIKICEVLGCDAVPWCPFQASALLDLWRTSDPSAYWALLRPSPTSNLHHTGASKVRERKDGTQETKKRGEQESQRERQRRHDSITEFDMKFNHNLAYLLSLFRTNCSMCTFACFPLFPFRASAKLDCSSSNCCSTLSRVWFNDSTSWRDSARWEAFSCKLGYWRSNSYDTRKDERNEENIEVLISDDIHGSTRRHAVYEMRSLSQYTKLADMLRQFDTFTAALMDHTWSIVKVRIDTIE